MLLADVMMRPVFSGIFCFLLLAPLKLLAGDSDRCLVVSVADQKIAVVENGWTLATFPVSTSRYGVGDNFNSFATPLGRMEVAGKIGDGAPLGAVFRHRQWTGEILRPNATGRDPIVTRILWLRGLEYGNQNAFTRNIYIHGTPVERLIGRPASYGCIRMRSRDVVELFNMTPVGAIVQVSREHLHQAVASLDRMPHFVSGEDRIASNTYW
jgi:lipoprotein-anchoring transpeptidase ErfK/SrfK